MNMQVLKRNRKRPECGDIFAYKLRGFDFGFGRVIRTDARMEPLRDLLLLYIYNAFSPQMEEIPELRKGKLLFPPVLLMDHGAWGKGYFLTVKKRPLRPMDILKTHCFWDDVYSCYRNEYERKLSRRTRPCGLHAVGSYVTIDVQISLALGIEPHPDTLP